MHSPSNRLFVRTATRTAARTAVALALGLAVGLAAAQAPAGQDAVPVQSAGKIPPVTGSREKPVPSWGKPLPYPVVIADRRNNRLLEVAPDKRVIWRFGSPNLKIYHDNDDVYFAPDGRWLAISEEDNQDIHLIDYYDGTLAWSYGIADQPGNGPGQMNFPDDAHLIDHGKTVMVADIRNCRILFIDQATSKIETQWGGLSRRGGHWAHDPSCRHDPPRHFGLPNGDVELPNGDILISEILGSWITEVRRDGTVVWSMHTPGGMQYPSDAMPTRDGQVIVAGYTKPGRVIIFDPKTRKITWDYHVLRGEGMLNHPSLAEELPNGDVILNDDYRDRVIVIDRKTKKIIWQYGHTDVKGSAPGYLNNPDGIDIDVYRDWKAALQAQK